MAATGGIYAAPTDYPVIFALLLGRGRGLPRPYRAMIFVARRSYADNSSHASCMVSAENKNSPFSL